MKPIPISLNTLSYNAVITALETIRDAPNPPSFTDIYIDTVGDPSTYKSKLTSVLGENFARFTIEKKADATYKVKHEYASFHQLINVNLRFCKIAEIFSGGWSCIYHSESD